MSEHPHVTTAREDSVLPAVVRGLVNHTILSRDTVVTGARVYRRDVVLSKGFPRGVVRCVTGRGRKEDGKGMIREFSMRSRFRLLHKVKNAGCDFFCMVTLTYPREFPCSGSQTKHHFKNFRMRLLRKFPEVQGVWFLEFQRRGAPHYHVLLSLKLWELGDLVEKVRMHNKLGVRKFRTVDWVQDLISQWWYEIVGSGDSKHLRAGAALEVIEEGEGALRYAACHASKPHQKKVPDGFSDVGRFWGVIGKVEVPCLDIQPASTEEIFEKFGAAAMSNRGRVKKYLWDASELFLSGEEKQDCEKENENE